MPDCFRGQAYIASPYLVLDITAEHWPVVFSGYELTCFLDTEVAYQQIVVMPTNKLCSDDFWDVGEALVVQDAVDVVPALLAELLVGCWLALSFRACLFSACSLCNLSLMPPMLAV